MGKIIYMYIYIYIYIYTHVLHLTKYEMNKGQYNILSDLNIKSTKDTFWCGVVQYNA